jgi:Arc/MetJ family transcription regulator
MAKNKAQPAQTSPVGQIAWADDVAEHDYAAAEAYLSIKFDKSTVADAVRRLRKAPLTTRRANDILRAAGLTAARLDDPGVMKDLIKVIERTRLSPVLVVRDTDKGGADIADGYHRISLVYRIDPFGDVPLKLA